MYDTVPVSALATLHVRRVGLERPWAWLGAACRDIAHAPQLALQYGAATVAASWIVVAVLWSAASLPLLLPLLAGFAIVAPLLAAGLYTISAAIEDGRMPGWRDTQRALAGNATQIALMGGFLLLLHLFWIRVATLLFAVFFARADIGWRELPDLLLGSAAGLTFLLIGSAVGAAFALFSFACTVVAIPLLLDRKVDVVTAIVTSWIAFRHNRAALLLWAALIAGAVLFSFVTFFAGLLLAMPLIGFASWHAYRDLVLPETSL